MAIIFSLLRRPAYVIMEEYSVGGKDISEKMLEEYSDVFADIFNGLLFEGRKVIDPEDLTDVPGQRSQFRADDGALHEQERDVSKFWGKEGSILSLFEIGRAHV